MTMILRQGNREVRDSVITASQAGIGNFFSGWMEKSKEGEKTP
jgi:hypothetical protein